ncbi:MAG: phosphatase PAP2 family protein [Methylobacterium mesophilicum]|nr:phosphatase PAP2 family protein [Methylobacterium mesophilicum]
MRLRVEFITLCALVVLAGGAWGFVGLLQIAGATEPHALDRQILLFFRNPADLSDPIGPRWFEEAVRDFTSLGSVTVLLTVVIIAILFMVFSGRPRGALFLFVAVAGGQFLNSWLKLLIDRPRPDIVPPAVEVFTLSFPSGHAMLAAVTYLTVGALLARVVEGRLLKGYVMGVAVVLSVLVGISRLYLGVHWPSDVLAGLCAGAAWAVLCWLVARAVLSRRKRGEGLTEDAGGE